MFFYFAENKKAAGNIFCLLPTIIFSKSKLISWDVKGFSIFFGWLKFSFQINVCKEILSLNPKITEELMAKIAKFAKREQIKIKKSAQIVEFLNKQPNLILLLNNTDLSHPYIEKVFKSILQQADFSSADQTTKENML